MIGEKLFELRMQREISREVISNAIGVNRRTIAYWENGEKEPKASNIVALAKFFEVSADYLLGLSEY